MKLYSIGNSAFWGTDVTGTLVIPANVATIGGYAFVRTKLTGLDRSSTALYCHIYFIEVN